jgi:2-dehydropantoate 2-reductase
MKICFYGVGGVGGYFGSLIAQRFNGEHEIYFIARGKHKDSICANGITLKKSGGAEIINVMPKKCTDNIFDLPICDIVILSVKGYDLENAVKNIYWFTNMDSVILPLLNGVDIYDRIRKYLNTAFVLPSCVYIGTHIESPGVINQNGGNGKILIGYDPLYPDFYPESLMTVLKESKIDFLWEENVQVSIWSKFMFIAAYGLVTATYEKTLGEILKDSELSKTTKSIMTEIEKIAKRLKIPLNSDIVETSFLKGKQFPFDTKTSFQRDVEVKGRINEADIFGGTIIRYGDEFGINVSNTREIHERLMSKFE